MGLFRFPLWRIASLSLILTLSTAGLLHAVIPHGDTHSLAQYKSECEAEYGYGHCDGNRFIPADAHEEGIWSFIHALLAHEDKKVLALSAGTTLMFLMLHAIALRSRFADIPRRLTSRYEEALASGTLPFRRFG